MSNYSEVESLVLTVRDRIERGTLRDEAERYYLSEPGGGGYTMPYLLEDALSEAMWLTSDECRMHRCLIVSNSLQDIIAVVYDENVFVPVEMLKPPGAGEEDA